MTVILDTGNKMWYTYFGRDLCNKLLHNQQRHNVRGGYMSEKTSWFRYSLS